MAFQQDAFQHNAFQIGLGGAAAPPADVPGPTYLDEIEDDYPGGGGFCYQIGREDGADQIFCFYEDYAEEPEDEDYGFFDFQRPPDVVVVVDQIFNFDVDDPDPGEDEAVYWATGPPDLPLPPDDTGETREYYPAESEEPEPEDYGFVDYQLPSDDTGETIVYLPEQSEEPEDEDFTVQVDSPRPADDTGQTTWYWPDESEEPDPEDFGFIDFQTPPDFFLPQPLTLWYYPDESEEPEDEGFGTDADFQLPPDDTGESLVYWPDESEEPEPEDFGYYDSQIPEDFAAEQPLGQWEFPAESEEPEPEDFGTQADSQTPPDDTGQTSFYWPDESEEPEDENFGTDADFQLPPDQVTTQDQFYPTLSDDLPEDEEEAYGFDDFQIPEDGPTPPPPAPAFSGGAYPGDKDDWKYVRQEYEELPPAEWARREIARRKREQDIIDEEALRILLWMMAQADED